MLKPIYSLTEQIYYY